MRAFCVVAHSLCMLSLSPVWLCTCSKAEKGLSTLSPDGDVVITREKTWFGKNNVVCTLVPNFACLAGNSFLASLTHAAFSAFVGLRCSVWPWLWAHVNRDHDEQHA